MAETWPWRSEAAHKPLVHQCLQLGVALLVLVEQWGDRCMVWDENGKPVGWLASMM
jgi:uncharacterized protein with GYD domain